MLIAIGVPIFIIVIIAILKVKKNTTIEDKNARAERMNKEDCTYWDDLTKK